MKKYRYILPIFFASLALVIWGCSDDNSSDGPEDNFDRSAMLENWAGNIIIPAHQAFDANTSALKVASDNFETTPSMTNFNTLRNAWETAYISWQNIEMYLAGPAVNVFFVPGTQPRSFINAYPTNTDNIDSFISSGNYDLSLNNTFDEQGFPALDYLLYGLADTDADILAFYTGADSSDYLNYLTDVVDNIDSKSNQVLSSWEGDYRNTFVSNSGSSVTSSTNIFVNAYMQYYEILFRNGKIGIPAGISAQGAGTPVPENVEAFYNNDLSKRLYLEALDAVQGFFRGTTFNGTTNGESLESYLDFLNTMKNGEDLSTLINNQFGVIRTSANNLNDSFFNQINTNNTLMLSIFEDMQDNVILLKSDMFSALDIQVSFFSGDGD